MQFFFIVLVVFILPGCGGEKIDPNLNYAIGRYYFGEQSGDWSAVYDMRSGSFVSSTDREYYIEQMKNDNSGWRLLKWEVRTFKYIKDGVAEVEMTFLEKAPSEFLRGLGNVNAARFFEKTVWKKEDGHWKCHVCGKRGHLYLNGGV